MQAFETVKNDPKAVEVEYETTSDSYYALYNGKRMDSVVSFWFVDAVRYKYYYEMQKSDPESLAYKITDFNKDGVPELFVGYGDENGVRIYDLYTFKKGKAVRLNKDMKYRNAWYALRKNGIIQEKCSSGAATGETIFHKISKSGKLTNFIALTWDYQYHAKTKDGRTSSISEAEFNRIWQKYNKPTRTTFYKADSKAVKLVKTGKFLYKGQKNFNVVTEI